MRNVQAAPRAVLAGYNGDVDALKESESWLFTDAPVSKSQGGTMGLPNAGASSDEGKTMRRWRKLAGVAFEGPCGEARAFGDAVICHVTIGTARQADYAVGSAPAADVAALQDDVAGIDGNLSVATSVQVVESAVTEPIDDLDELSEADF